MTNKSASVSALFFLAFLTVSAAGQPAATQQQGAAPQSAPNPQQEAENKQMHAALRHGPTDITLHDEAVLKLPKGEVFLPAKEAAILMRRMGNFTNDNFLGVILPEDGGDWFVGADFDDSG